MKKKRRIFLRIGIVIFIIYVVMSFVVLQANINEREQKIRELKAEIQEQQIALTILSEAIASDPDEETYRRAAREKLGLIDMNEKVIIDIS